MKRSLRGLIEPNGILLDVPATCKRSVMEQLAGLSAERFGLNSAHVLEKLNDREQLGSTGVGGGIAIPHARLDIPKLSGLLLRLRDKVTFEAIDGEPVDLIFLLLAPEADNANHLKALSRIARVFRQSQVVSALRGANTAEAAFATITSESDQEAA
ncbi:MAG: PTS sugar transporter subunit IIA [Parvularculaceae bacterium]|nr:PTS sugar transporter subunit IIA [Parvularculaceae bacterium]